MHENEYDMLIIGAGISGTAIARELSKYKLKIELVEKNVDIEMETTHANSAIVHTGYDPEPRTLMAQLNEKEQNLVKNSERAGDKI